MTMNSFVQNALLCVMIAALGACVSSEDTARAEREAQSRRIQELTAQTRVTAQQSGRGGQRQSGPYAAYQQAWASKVLRVGNRYYSAVSPGEQESGDVTLSVALNVEGRIRKISVVRSSGKPALDELAVKIIRLAEPFAPFPPEIRRQTNVLVLTQKFVFRSAASR